MVEGDSRDRVHAVPARDGRRICVDEVVPDVVRGRHRAPSILDLMIAAAAELSRRTVLHLDNDFELIAELTGQPTERLRLG